jgi:hypothetical protein
MNKPAGRDTYTQIHTYTTHLRAKLGRPRAPVPVKNRIEPVGPVAAATAAATAAAVGLFVNVAVVR